MNSSPQIEIQLLKNLYQPFGVSVSVMRLDKIHPVVSGNKWFKLTEHLKEAKALKKGLLLTYGGAYSNHIVATAAACREAGIRSAGIIRGEEPADLSPSLKDAKAYGMDLHFVSRAEYKKKIIPAAIIQSFKEGDVYIVGEGGYGLPGRLGASAILSKDTVHYTHIITAVGTGTTLAGLRSSATEHQQIIGISSLKNHYGLASEIDALLPAHKKGRFNLNHDYHFGGYAKWQPELIGFMNDWYSQTGIPSDFVYTGKLFFGADDLIKKERFLPGSNILLIHSGGLQGNRSLKKGTLIF